MLLECLCYLAELRPLLDSRKRFVFLKLWQWTLLRSSCFLFSCCLCFILNCVLIYFVQYCMSQKLLRSTWLCLMFSQSLFPLRNISWTVVKMVFWWKFSHERKYGEMTCFLSTKIVISLKIFIFLLKNVNPDWILIYTWEEILKHHLIGLIKNVSVFVRK